jgi:hypothetical protein
MYEEELTACMAEGKAQRGDGVKGERAALLVVGSERWQWAVTNEWRGRNSRTVSWHHYSAGPPAPAPPAAASAAVAAATAAVRSASSAAMRRG